MRFQLNFGTSHPLPPFLEGGGKSAPPRGFKEPKKAGSNRVNYRVTQKNETSKSVVGVQFYFFTGGLEPEPEPDPTSHFTDTLSESEMAQISNFHLIMNQFSPPF